MMAIDYDEVGDGTRVLLHTPEGFPDITGTIELHLNGVYGIDTGEGVTHLATAEDLDLAAHSEGERRRTGISITEQIAKARLEEREAVRRLVEEVAALGEPENWAMANLNTVIQRKHQYQEWLAAHPVEMICSFCGEEARSRCLCGERRLMQKVEGVRLQDNIEGAKPRITELGSPAKCALRSCQAPVIVQSETDDGRGLFLCEKHGLEWWDSTHGGDDAASD